MTAPFCSPECKANNGWLTDADGIITGRCPCRHREPTVGSVAAEVVERSDWLAEWERSHE